MLHEADYRYAACSTVLCDASRDLLTFVVIHHRTYYILCNSAWDLLLHPT